MVLKHIVEIVAAAGLTALSLSSPSLAHDLNRSNGWHQGHMSGFGHGMGQGHMVGPGYGMGQGHMMGPGYGMGLGHMMGPGFSRQGNVAPGTMPSLRGKLDTDDVRQMMEYRLRWMDNPNIKLGKVEVSDTDTITAEIVTQDGSLVERLKVDRHTGLIGPSR